MLVLRVFWAFEASAPGKSGAPVLLIIVCMMLHDYSSLATLVHELQVVLGSVQRAKGGCAAHVCSWPHNQGNDSELNQAC